MGDPQRRQQDAAQLTPREREVLRLLGRSLPNKQIARRLGVADQTVKNHVRAILDKLEVGDRLGAVVRGLKQGLLTQEELDAPRVDREPWDYVPVGKWG